MPIYEFSCRQCGHCFEALCRLGGESGVSCPGCGSHEVQKLFSSFGIGGGGSRLKNTSSSCASCSSSSCSTCH